MQAMDSAICGQELMNSDHNMSQQQSAVSPVSPLRPALIPSSQILPLAASHYYSTPPPSQLQHLGRQQQRDVANSATKVKLNHAASGNGLGASLTGARSGNDHKTSDQVMTDQAREILRQAVVNSLVENASAAGATKAGVVNAPNDATVKSKGAARYFECQKNHAAGIGGHALDGCGEFMPSGNDDDALRCAACDCHRNFHRREVEGETSHDCKLRKPRPLTLLPTTLASTPGRSTQLALTYTANNMTPLAMAAAMSAGEATDSDDQNDGPGNNILTGSSAMHLAMRSPSASKKLKRFRTKFSTDQKDKMCAFSEKLGWRIQKHDEPAVQEFCAAVGVKRHVLKVWMHNNKHTMGKKP